ncbi:hypothetical protein A5750_20935 [Mycobacterium sp. 852002-51613_SCH5001154]|uniref:hypothetical protein n=1 Tax=Mycobacterium sp. 852002-51613_SCH5001154 TaxID=1834104 RepID=UPI0007FF270D|nr:hypothetical protein [Mycobacterium sp. 852002-51613_SCH5001154]OBF70983.1 hypothetical protein A5750_20935 [Mycobacterium sp. 852002-51613_SCH5001154]
MAGVAGVPGLSALLAWPTDHLTEAADYWETVGERSYGVAHQVWRDALSVDWRGDAALAVRSATHSDMTSTSAVVDQLRAAAGVARGAASDLTAARSRVRYAVEDGRSAGFVVGEDLSVSDRMVGGSTVQQAARQAQAQALASDIRQRAVQLVSLDQEVAGKISVAVAGIRDTFPADNHVRGVANHTFKDAPQPAMSREQAKAGLRDVNRRIWEHNNIDKPVIDRLPPNDPRRADFNFEAEQLNSEKRQYLDVLFHQHPPETVAGPHGEQLPGVPAGESSTGPADSGKGWLFPIQPGQAGCDPRVTTIRVMEPTPQYPNGYVVYMNGMGQTVNPFTGRTIPPSDDFAHIPLPE